MFTREIEILAPAGSVESLKAAIHAGADAVYIGGARFGARAYADNPEQEELLHGIDYVHLHGKKIYLTVNTLLKNEEIQELYEYLLPYYKRGLDAVIVQDFGVFSFIRRHFQQLDIHASTQMVITGAEGAALLEQAGATRVVTARESTLEDIRRIREKTGLEIESFVHGALCYCYSGQCLMSSMLGGRSGNRGRCAQPCRLPYQALTKNQVMGRTQGAYVLSPKDICTIEILPQILEAGVTSLKIEGRMKSPEYTAGVVSIYRKYVDLYLEKGKDGYAVSKEDYQKLEQIYSRSGFHEGYYQQPAGKHMITFTKPSYDGKNDKVIQQIHDTYVKEEKKIPIQGIVRIRTGETIKITATYGKKGRSSARWTETAEGIIVSEAQRQPLGRENIEKQLRQTGNTPFVWETLQIELSNNAFCPVKEIKELRRTVLERLSQAILEDFYRTGPADMDIRAEDLPLPEKNNAGNPSKNVIELNCIVSSGEQLEAVLAYPQVCWVYLSCDTLDVSSEMVEKIHRAGKRAGLVMPYIFRRQAEDYIQGLQELLSNQRETIDAFLVRNPDEIHYIKKHFPDKKLRFDYYLYTMNDEAAEMLQKLGASEITEPLELNYRELCRKKKPIGELVAYGYVPLMITANCIHKNLDSCDRKKADLSLIDRYQTSFPVKNICRFCYNIIYNSIPLSLLSVSKEVLQLNPKGIRLQFTTEDHGETRNILQKFVDAYWKHMEVDELAPSTRGHFKRGVE